MNEEFLPIDDYGIIGNDDRCALIGRNGSIDWCSFPHLESPSVFAAILDTEDGGRFAVQPASEYESNHEYVDRTNVLQTTFETDDGAVTVTDCMPVREGEAPDERFQQAVYRKLEGVSGTVELDVVFEPRFDYARATTAIEIDDDGDVIATERDALGDDETDERDAEPEDEHDRDVERLYLHTDVDFDVDDATATATATIEEDETRWFCLQYGAPDYRSDDEYEKVLQGTIDYWRTWLDTCEESATDLFDFEDEWQDVLVRSALVLKLLIHDETGSIPAAPTASLPEEIGGELNWDYRYNWIRDAKFTIQALHSVGQSDEAHRYFEWFREIGHENPGEIQPLYGLHGEAEIGEETLDNLSGYRDSTPVRIGNAAATQEQLDIYGTIVQGIYETIRYENGLSEYDWESVHALAEYVCDHWDEKDKSIWEFRDLHEHFVHSKLLCWVALDRALRLAEEYDRDAPVDRWEDEREAIRNAIEDRGYDEELGSFVQFFGADEALDATALLIPLYDFLPADDERVQNTIDTLLEELTTEDGLVFRFANSPARPREPGGFLICSFWLVDALVLSDRLDEAEDLFETLVGHTSSIGLLSEMIHAETGEFLGNFPQAFSHIGLINSAIYLASASERSDQLPPEELSSGSDAPLFQRHGS
ncbi:glycoside hydrolase family 15 protein [Natrarchaeobius chitinivorans]|uniref:Glycoside hydrolase family 15 protein n=1 Tax=Natrarchaeobius chitinivorans TaxID=1679083 RepID=A0A3N6LUU9_NATCH|nr:glycoside hydrolase family 15 protein [Natrarchaeobius chitinivorans]RQG92477.1 glycoside hydrolase family 15 protein [Natrarchaeobius chitinivorans]